MIFDLTRKDWIYKGVLFAEMDFTEIDKLFGMPPQPKDFCAGIITIIYLDENKNWIYKGRVKFPNGNKQVHEKNFGKVSSETQILQEMYSKIPMKNKIWNKNPSGLGTRIYEIIQKLDMIESISFKEN